MDEDTRPEDGIGNADEPVQDPSGDENMPEVKTTSEEDQEDKGPE